MGEVKYQGKVYENVSEIALYNEGLFLKYVDGINYNVRVNFKSGDRLHIKSDKGKKLFISSLSVSNSCYIKGNIEKAHIGNCCYIIGKVKKLSKGRWCVEEKEWVKRYFERLKESFKKVYPYENRRKIIRLSGGFNQILTDVVNIGCEVNINGSVVSAYIGNCCYIEGNISLLQADNMIISNYQHW